MQQLTSKNRKELKNKMAKALHEHIKPLSAPLQEILIDDLVTAFESRLSALNPKERNVSFSVYEEIEIVNH